MSHEMLLKFLIDEKFIDNDGNDCSNQHPLYLAENLIESGLMNPEFYSAVYDGEVIIDDKGKVSGFITEELRKKGWIQDVDGIAYIIRR